MQSKSTMNAPESFPGGVSRHVAAASMQLGVRPPRRTPAPRLLRSALAAAAPLCITLWAPLAGASPAFPQAVAEHLELACTPQCTLCHTTNPGTKTTFGGRFGLPFAIAKGAPSGSVPAALDKLRADGSDVDMDSVNDIDQIIANSNPNRDGEAVCLGPTYGCGAQVEPRGSFAWGPLAGLCLAGAGLFAWARRQKKSGVSGA